MSQKTALIAGATGAASIRLVEVLIADPEWSVVGLSRNPPSSPHDRLTYIGADLMDAAGTKAALAPHGQITHAFYTSRAPFKEGGVEDVGQGAFLVTGREVVADREAQAPDR